MDKNEKILRQRQEDVALHKTLYWMGGAALLIVLLRGAQKYYVNFKNPILAWNIGRALPWLLVGALLLAAGGYYLAVRTRRKGSGMVLPWALGIFFLGCAACVAMIWAFAGSGIQLMTYLVIGAAVLAMVYYLYQHDFAAVALAGGLGMLGLWGILREGGTLRVCLAVALLVVLLAALVILTRVLQKKHGVLTVKGKEHELLPKSANYLLIYITCAMMALLLLAALVLGGVLSAMVYYAVPVAWLLIMAVYYTVKLM